MTNADCTYLYFKPSGKWKYEGRGRFPDGDVNRRSIMQANEGFMPGITSNASDMIVVVIPDDGCTTGFAYPRMLLPTETP